MFADYRQGQGKGCVNPVRPSVRPMWTFAQKLWFCVFLVCVSVVNLKKRVGFLVKLDLHNVCFKDLHNVCFKTLDLHNVCF